MKMFTTAFRIALLCVLSMPAILSAASFSEDFEGNLAQWTGKGGGSHNGEIVLDPLASGQGGVVHFTNVTFGGDMFASTPIVLSGPIEISFDYLGRPSLGGTPGDLGGFFGIAYSLTAVTDGVDLFWHAGTQNSYPGLLINLEDDGAWHHHSFQLNASAMPPFHLILEDFVGSGGVSGDVFFDNITVTMVPEPTTAGLTLLGLMLTLRRRA